MYTKITYFHGKLIQIISLKKECKVLFLPIDFQGSCFLCLFLARERQCLLKSLTVDTKIFGHALFYF